MRCKGPLSEIAAKLLTGQAYRNNVWRGRLIYFYFQPNQEESDHDQ